MKRILFLDLIFFFNTLHAMQPVLRSLGEVESVETQTDDYLNNRQLHEIVTPESPVTPVQPREPQGSPKSNGSVEIEVGNKNICFLRCKLKSSRAALCVAGGLTCCALGVTAAYLYSRFDR